MEKGALDVRFGKNVAKLRRERKWTQDHLGEKTNLAKNTIQRIETAVIGITTNNLEALSKAFNVDASELLIGDNDAMRAVSTKLVRLSGADLDWLMRLIAVLEEKLPPVADK